MNLQKKSNTALKKTSYKKMEKIPKNWNLYHLISLCKKNPQYGANVSALSKNEKLPRYIRITDLNNDGTLRDKEWKSITEKNAKDYLLHEGDVLFARTGATVGKSYLYRNRDGRCAFVGYLIRFVPDFTKIEPQFLFQYVHSSHYWNWLHSVTTEGVQPNVNAEEYSNLSILTPPVEEQKKISSILYHVESLIQNTQETIQQIQKLKQGLLQKLIHDSSGWEKRKLGDICDIFDFKRIPLSGSERSKKQGKIPYYGASGIIDYIDDFIFNEKLLCLSEDGENLRSRVLPIAFTIQGKTWVNNHAHVLKPKKEIILHDYLESFLNSIKLDKFLGFTAQPKLNQKDMKQIPIILPSIKKQQSISNILSNINNQLKLEIQFKSQLENLKKGLMQKLLTGQIRV